MSKKIRIAVIGPGEVGSRVAVELAEGGADVIGFDLTLVAEVTIPAAETIDAAVADADVVLSVNSSSAALRAAERVAPLLDSSALYADLNTTTPALKKKLAELFAADSFVDGAVMASGAEADSGSHLALAGPAAQQLIDLLTPLNVSAEFVSLTVGHAAARNLTRSLLAKCLAGAVIDYMWAAEALGLADWAYDDMLREFDAMDRSTAMSYLEQTVKNAKRREIEMLDIVEMLEEADYHSLFVPPTQLVYNKVYHSIKVPHANQ